IDYKLSQTTSILRTGHQDVRYLNSNGIATNVRREIPIGVVKHKVIQEIVIATRNSDGADIVATRFHQFCSGTAYGFASDDGTDRYNLGSRTAQRVPNSFDGKNGSDACDWIARCHDHQLCIANRIQNPGGRLRVSSASVSYGSNIRLRSLFHKKLLKIESAVRRFNLCPEGVVGRGYHAGGDALHSSHSSRYFR